MKKKDISNESLKITLSMLNTKWKPLIIKAMLTGTKRFGEIKSAVEGITQKVLTLNLKDMEEKGLLIREVYHQMPPKVEYTLTDIGYSLAMVLDSMAEWGSAYQEFMKLMEKQKTKSK